MLYVILRTQSAGNAIATHVVKADIDRLSGTAALESRLRDPPAWTFLPSRLAGLTAYGGPGYDGSFRFSSYFMPAIDPATGRLFAVVHALDPITRRARALISRPTDGAVTWSTPTPLDDPGKGNQLMPSVAARGGRVFAVWYDSRNDLEFAPLSPIRGVDVYAAVLDDALKVEGVSRLTPETQRADRPVFTRTRPVGASSFSGERPHDYDPASPKSDVVKAAVSPTTRANQGKGEGARHRLRYGEPSPGPRPCRWACRSPGAPARSGWRPLRSSVVSGTRRQRGGLPRGPRQSAREGSPPHRAARRKGGSWTIH